jgi:TRAP-type C4-dicarboxylate transport system substrate-binding protein
MKKTLTIAATASAICASSGQAAEPTMLRFALLAPPTTWVYTKAGDQWSKEVMAASDGTLDIKFFFGTQLGTVRNIYDRTVQGAVDIAFGTFGELTGQFQKVNVTTLPFETKDCYEAATALWRLYTNGTIADEFANIKPLVLFTFPGYVLSTTKPVKTLADMDGLKLVTTARLTSQGVQLLGGVPVTLIPTEIYSALQRGTAAGTLISWAAISVFRIEELTKYDVDTPFGHGPTYFFMNKEAFAKLPQVAQRAIERYSNDPLNQRLALAGAKVQEEAAADLAGKGHIVSELDAGVAQQWKQRLASITDEWVAATPDGAKVLAGYRAEIAKAAKEPRK